LDLGFDWRRANAENTLVGADHLSKHVMNGLCRIYGVTDRINEHSVVESTQLLFWALSTMAGA
jgi:hypothetical protein